MSRGHNPRAMRIPQARRAPRRRSLDVVHVVVCLGWRARRICQQNKRHGFREGFGKGIVKHERIHSAFVLDHIIFPSRHPVGFTRTIP